MPNPLSPTSGVGARLIVAALAVGLVWLIVWWALS
jgi:hypothetical protein